MFPLKDENPTRRRPILTYALIVTNSAIFVWALLSGTLDWTIGEYGMKPAEVLEGQRLHTLFSSMFLHGGILHILFNMWYLWIFGDNIEDVLGRGKFLLFYFGTGLAASFAHAFSVSGTPSAAIPAIGASGAISGILGGYMLLYPRAHVHTAVIIFFIAHIVSVPAMVMIGLWFLLQVVSLSFLLVTGVPTGIAYWAHIGGFIAGLFLILPFRKRAKKIMRGLLRHRDFL